MILDALTRAAKRTVIARWIATLRRVADDLEREIGT